VAKEAAASPAARVVRRDSGSPSRAAVARLGVIQRRVNKPIRKRPLGPEGHADVASRSAFRRLDTKYLSGWSRVWWMGLMRAWRPALPDPVYA